MARPFITRCPTCEQTVHHNHRCPGAAPKRRLDRQQFDRWRREAEQEARALAAADAQQELPLVLGDEQ